MSMSLALLTLLVPTVRADQCAWIDDATAKAAAKKLAQARSYRAWCEPCGDASPGPTVPVQQVNVRPTGSGSFEVVTNGTEALDLAYTYIPGDAGTWTNLGLLLSCGASGVSSKWVDPATRPRAKPAAPSTAAASSGKGSILSQKDEPGPGEYEATSANYAAVITTECNHISYVVNFTSQGAQSFYGPFTVAVPGIYATEGKTYDGSAGPLPRYFDPNQVVVLHNGKSAVERVRCVD
jgi:hypothetical protein